MDKRKEKRCAASGESRNELSLPVQAGDNSPSPIRDTLHAESDGRVYESIRATLSDARMKAITAINTAMVIAYWEIGKEITEAVGDRAEYGKHLLQFLSERLTVEFGKGFTVANLRNMRQFYQTFPIRYTLCSELSWSHYRMLIRIEDESIAKYSVLADNENLFASKYRLYLPTEDELKAELLRERELLERQIEGRKNEANTT